MCQGHQRRTNSRPSVLRCRIGVKTALWTEEVRENQGEIHDCRVKWPGQKGVTPPFLSPDKIMEVKEKFRDPGRWQAPQFSSNLRCLHVYICIVCASLNLKGIWNPWLRWTIQIGIDFRCLFSNWSSKLKTFAIKGMKNNDLLKIDKHSWFLQSEF